MTKLIEKCKFVVGFPPVDINTAMDNTTYTKGDYVNMKNWGHLTIVLIGGVSAGGTGSVTVKCATSVAGGSVDSLTTVKWRYLNTNTSTASDTWTKTAVTAYTWDHPATANLSNVIEIDADELPTDHNFVAINIDSAGGTTLMSCLYILSEPRYISAETAPTAIS
jgi:hypothetical protein